MFLVLRQDKLKLKLHISWACTAGLKPKGGKKEVKLDTSDLPITQREHNSATDSSPVSVASSFDFIWLGSDNTFKSKTRLGQHCFMHPAWEYNERSWKPVKKALPADRTGNAKNIKWGLVVLEKDRKTAGRYRNWMEKEYEFKDKTNNHSNTWFKFI